ncbi:MAG: ABC transporter ATP-binding protein [Oscillospiraceae bacterium]|nr:ABC transporter ATP-binding protein [Oscillospiraceae bacterium]
MKLMKQLFYIFPTKQRLQYAGLFILQLIETALDFFGVALILPFVNLLVNAEQMQASWWYRIVVRLIGTEEMSSVLLFLTGLMALVYLVKNLFIMFLTWLRINFIGKSKIRMGARMITCYMHKPYTFHLQRNTSEIIRNINGDVNGAFSVISSMFALVSDALIVISLTTYLFAVDLQMTVGILIALAICSALYFLVVRKKIRTIGQENRKVTAKMYKAIQQAMGGIKEVKIMGREKFFADVYKRSGAESVELSKRYNIIAAIPGRLIETLCMFAILTIVAVKILKGEDLAQIVPNLSAFAVAAIRLMPRANSINGHINSITFNKPSMEALYEDLTESDREEAERQKEIEEKKKQNRKVDIGEERNIFAKNITYTYPNKTEPVLKNVNVTVNAGESVGIVGVTGAGKTTLVDIILGLLKPQDGTVCYGALDIHEDYGEWQKHIGYIPQFIYLIDDTIRNNVALGLEAEKIDEDAVWRALENAQLADFVRTLEDGLDTVIGERGVRISGGQRQRIGIARALYYDPEILFFDEATSSLDNETEKAVMKSVNALGAQKTMIVVAHRLTTLSGCDRIYKVENGGVTETTIND